VLGDSRHAETTQFDMVRAFVFLAGLPFLPFRPTDKVDIVNVDFVADSVVALHQKEKPDHDIYHLSSGTASQTFRELTDALASAQRRRKPRFVPSMEKSFTALVERLAKRKSSLGYGATLMKVFLPYLVWNTVFDNSRVVTERGCAPAPFSQYSYPLLKFSKDNRFTYNYKEWPASGGASG
jgi:nucleoside-diphosphate-sugar epimerase